MTEDEERLVWSCSVEHEFDYVRCSRPVGHTGRHSGMGDDGGAYIWPNAPQEPTDG